jgi:hypothetical protein
MELSKNVLNRMKLLKAFGFPLSFEQALIQVAQLGEERWFEVKNIFIEQIKENLLKSGTAWQRSRLRED